MIGTKLIEEFVQSVALSHQVEGHSRISCLLLASPESGKTTIANKSTLSKHVVPVVFMTGKSVIREVKENPRLEFMLFNDLTVIRAMSSTASNFLVTTLNQFTQNERGKVGFAGKKTAGIERPIGIIGCMPFKTFSDKRSSWREFGFISRMLIFSYAYADEIVARIKDSIDDGSHVKKKTAEPLPKITKKIDVKTTEHIIRQVRNIADSKSKELGQLGIRILANYHCLVKAHALLMGRTTVTADDIAFLRAVDRHVSVKECPTLLVTPEHEEVRQWRKGKQSERSKNRTLDRESRKGIRSLNHVISTRQGQRR
jgi:hypothetical protein